MIDVVFNLLIFFVVGAGAFTADKMLATKLSATEGTLADAQIAEDRPSWAVNVDLHLKLSADNQPIVEMNGTDWTDRKDLKRALQELAEVSPESPIHLETAGNVPLGEMIDVYDACRAAGFQTINFVTRAESKPRVQ